MKSLIDYLNNTTQYESILNPNQDQVMGRMTDDVDDMIHKRIREYCTQKSWSDEKEWLIASPALQITKVDKDKKGWYVDTNASTITLMDGSNTKSYYGYCRSKGQKIDKQKGFLIKDIGVYFRWRKHEGASTIYDIPYFESTDGFPEEMDYLRMNYSCTKSKKLTIYNKINVIDLEGIGDLKISGNGCKNIVISPYCRKPFVTAPSEVKIYQPKSLDEYYDIISKLRRGHAITN